MAEDRYGPDVLGTDWRSAGRNRSADLDAVPGLVVEDASSGWCGAVTRVERDLGTVVLEDRHGISRTFPLGPGFLAEGEPVVLRAPTRLVRTASGRTASGSVAVPDAAARVARASRIFVEGRHDAELVERVWGDDLRVEGVVVEYLEGIDLLAGVLEDFGPGPGRRVGVLVDHLVPGSKESRHADEILRGPYREHVLVVGHPYIDIWQAVKPASVGIPCWPSVPRDEEWKSGVARRLGWPATSRADVAEAWRRVLASVRSYADLEPALLGKVEELIDFVTAQPG
jgi:Protein of unknown function (DUF3097)